MSYIVNMVVKKLYLEYMFLRQTYYLVVKRVKIGMLLVVVKIAMSVVENTCCSFWQQCVYLGDCLPVVLKISTATEESKEIFSKCELTADYVHGARFQLWRNEESFFFVKVCTS